MLKIDMLSGLSVQWNELPLIEQSSRVNKPQELLVLLVLNRASPFTNEQLIEALWEEGAIQKPEGALKNAVYSLRKLLEKAQAEAPFIITQNKNYCWNPKVPVELDVERFQQLYQQIKSNAAPAGSKLTLCRDALKLYRGDFLPGPGDQHWAIPFASSLRRQYLDLVEMTSQQLLAAHTQKDAEEAMALCQRAVSMDPLAESLYVGLFCAMQQLNMRSAILQYCPVVENLFLDELGEPLPNSLKAIYHWAADRPNPAIEDIYQVQRELEETSQQDSGLSGAYFCPYEVFRYMFHVMMRSSLRTNGCMMLFLMTLLPLRGREAPEGENARVMLAIKEQIMQVLRKGDIYSRYSHNQYVLLLLMRDPADVEVVIQRLYAAYHDAKVSRFLRLDISVGKPEVIV